MAADQYCLKWNNHQSTLLVQFETLLESDSLTDCTLSAEGKYLNVHKVLLSACSPYFSKLLGEHKDKHPIFFMKDVAFEELKGIVEYMYKGEVNIMQERLDSFLKTASSLQIKGLADQDGGKGEDREEDPGGGRAKRKQAPDLRGGYGESSPMPEEPPRSPKRRRRPRPVSQDDSLPAQDQNHCDTTTAPSFSQLQQQQEVVMPTPLVPVKKTEPVDNSMVHLKTEIPDDVPQVDVQDLTLDDDEDFNNEDITQPGTSFSETSQDFAQWQQQMATQSGADESFMAATQGINQSGSQGSNTTKSCELCKKVFEKITAYTEHLKYCCKSKLLCNICRNFETYESTLLEEHRKKDHSSMKNTALVVDNENGNAIKVIVNSSNRADITKSDEICDLTSNETESNVCDLTNDDDNACIQSDNEIITLDTDVDDSENDAGANSTTVRQNSVNCPLCLPNIKPLSRNQERDHFKLVHSNSILKCDQCRFISSKAIDLVNHYKVEHDQILHLCPHCDAIFKINYHLPLHILACHRPVKPVWCPWCSFKSDLLITLKSHFLDCHEQNLLPINEVQVMLGMNLFRLSLKETATTSSHDYSPELGGQVMKKSSNFTPSLDKNISNSNVPPVVVEIDNKSSISEPQYTLLHKTMQSVSYLSNGSELIICRDRLKSVQTSLQPTPNLKVSNANLTGISASTSQQCSCVENLTSRKKYKKNSDAGPSTSKPNRKRKVKPQTNKQKNIRNKNLQKIKQTEIKKVKKECKTTKSKRSPKKKQSAPKINKRPDNIIRFNLELIDRLLDEKLSSVPNTPKETEFYCTFCPRVFTSITSLEDHKNVSHSNISN